MVNGQWAVGNKFVPPNVRHLHMVALPVLILIRFLTVFNIFDYGKKYH